MKKGLLFYTLALSMAVLIGGCGVKKTQDADTDTAQETVGEDAPAASGEKAEETREENTFDGTVDGLEGEWELAYITYHQEYVDGDIYDSVSMADDPYAPSSELRIRKEGGDYLADYKMYANGVDVGYTDRIYGNCLIIKEEPAYADCENQKWHAEFTKVFDDDEDKILTLTAADTLITYEHYVYDDPEYGYTSDTVYTYIKADSPKLENRKDLRYFNTVTVSSVEELGNAIADNTKIILEAGEYKLDTAVNQNIQNEKLNTEAGQFLIEGVSNLSIEAKEGAAVTMTTTHAYDPVLYFKNSTNVSLHGLTLGHDVEPGYCSGSVVCLDNGSGIDISGCNLYGSGTYGVEAFQTDRIDVSDSSIYECTYGLLYLTNTSDAHFTNCEMMRSFGFEMFDLTNSYGVVFENCRIHDNDATAESYASKNLIKLGEYGDVKLKNCTLTNNKYEQLADRTEGVTLESCTVENNF